MWHFPFISVSSHSKGGLAGWLQATHTHTTPPQFVCVQKEKGRAPIKQAHLDQALRSAFGLVGDLCHDPFASTCRLCPVVRKLGVCRFRRDDCMERMKECRVRGHHESCHLPQAYGGSRSMYNAAYPQCLKRNDAVVNTVCSNHNHGYDRQA